MRWDLDYDDGITVDTSEPEPTPSCGPVARQLEAQGLHYPLSLEPLALASGVYSPNVGSWHGVVDTGTGRVLGAPVTARYKIVQPMDIAGLLDAAVDAGEVTDLDKIQIRSWDSGAKTAFRVPVSVSMDDLTDHEKADIVKTRRAFKRGLSWDDALIPPQDAFLTVTNSHGGTGGIHPMLELRFLACDNGYIKTLKRKGMTIRHTGTADRRLEQLRKALAAARYAGVLEQQQTLALLQCGLSQDKFQELLDKLFPMPTKEFASKREKDGIMARREEYTDTYQSAPGSAPGTLWGAVAATTYWTTHLTRVHRTRDELSARHNLCNNSSELQYVSRYGLQLFGRSQAMQQTTMQWVTAQLSN